MRNRQIKQFLTATYTGLILTSTLFFNSSANLHVLAANERTVNTNGQKISVSISEDGDAKTLSIQNSDTKTEIGSLHWTDQNTTYSLSSDVNHSAITLSGFDNSTNTVALSYQADALNKRITTISTSVTNIENNIKSILQQADGSILPEDVREGQTFNSAQGIGLSGTMPKLASSSLSINQTVDTANKDINLSAKAVTNTGNPYSYTDKNGVLSKSYSVKAYLNQSGTAKTNKAIASNVVSGKVFSTSDGINQTGSMGKAAGSNVSAMAVGGTKIKVTVKSNGNGVYKYVDNSGDTNTTIDLTTVKDSSGHTIAMGNAKDSKVLEDYTYSSNSGFNRTGTMVDRSKKKSGTPGVSTGKQEYTYIPVYEGTLLQYNTDTEGTKRISICPPEGYYPGNGSAYVGTSASNFGDASSSNVLSAKTFTSANGLKVEGTMPNNGAWTEVATGSGKITIPAGYHDGNGYVDVSGVYDSGFKTAIKSWLDGAGTESKICTSAGAGTSIYTSTEHGTYVHKSSYDKTFDVPTMYNGGYLYAIVYYVDCYYTEQYGGSGSGSGTYVLSNPDKSVISQRTFSARNTSNTYTIDFMQGAHYQNPGDVLSLRVYGSAECGRGTDQNSGSGASVKYTFTAKYRIPG